MPNIPNIDAFFHAPRCDRCGALARATTMSYFNTDTICMDCRTRERAHPKFEEARDAEIAACKGGNFNFPGIGLPDDLKTTTRKD
jgi:hypothetical protein